MTDSLSDATDAVADTVDGALDENPQVERVLKVGWLAKALVYTLMGVAALQIARQDAPADGQASPAGSVAAVADAPVGRLLLAVLTVGLVLYFLWRILSVAVIRGNEISAWADRVGYTFSGTFYLVLAYSAGKAAFTGVDPAETRTVESLSQSVMEVTGGRTMVGLAGLVTIGVGAYFAVQKGIRRSFTKHLISVGPVPSENEPKRRVLVVAGVLGWIGRGIVTALVGIFVVGAAIQFDPEDARGFDQSLRAVAGTGIGSALVVIAGLGLIAYGAFCLASYRFRNLEG